MLRFLEFCLIAGSAYWMTRQIVIPLWRNQPLFPARRRRRQLEAERRLANEQLEDEKMDHATRAILERAKIVKGRES